MALKMGDVTPSHTSGTEGSVLTHAQQDKGTGTTLGECLGALGYSSLVGVGSWDRVQMGGKCRDEGWLSSSSPSFSFPLGWPFQLEDARSHSKGTLSPICPFLSGAQEQQAEPGCPAFELVLNYLL